MYLNGNETLHNIPILWKNKSKLRFIFLIFFHIKSKYSTSQRIAKKVITALCISYKSNFQILFNSVTKMPKKYLFLTISSDCLKEKYFLKILISL